MIHKINFLIFLFFQSMLRYWTEKNVEEVITDLHTEIVGS